MMYADKYQNHFLFIVAGRARFATFARYVLNGLRLPGTPAALQALVPAFEEALTKFEAGIVRRVAGGGTAQGSTATEEEQWALIKTFIHNTDVEVVKPAYHKSPADLLKIYPDKLSGLTQTKHDFRLSRLTAYTEALEARKGKITDAPGKAARALLDDYEEVADTKQGAEKAVADTIAALGPDAEALCRALWEVHTLALYTFRAAPAQAAAFFDYDLLPQNKRPVAATPVPPVPPVG